MVTNEAGKLSKLVEAEVIPDKEKYIEVRESLKHCIQVIESLTEDLHQVQEDVEGHHVILERGIKELLGQLLEENRIFLLATELS